MSRPNPLTRTFAYVDHPSFGTAAADADLFPPGEPLPTLPPVAHLDLHGLNEKRDPVVLSKAEERRAFLQYNLSRCRAAQAQARATHRPADAAAARGLALWAGRADHLREYLARTNVALVGFAYCRQRARLTGLDADDAFSDGMAALARAVDKFDVLAGFKFSTYAVRAIFNALARGAKVAARQRAGNAVGLSPAIAEDCRRPAAAWSAEDVAGLRRVLDDDATGLTPDERYVVGERFLAAGGPRTLEAVGGALGVSKERARQVQLRALGKLRAALAPAA